MLSDPLMDFLGKLAGKGEEGTGTGMPSLLQELGSKVQLENAESLTGSISAEAGVSTKSLRLQQSKGEESRAGCFCLPAT